MGNEKIMINGQHCVKTVNNKKKKVNLINYSYPTGADDENQYNYKLKNSVNTTSPRPQILMTSVPTTNKLVISQNNRAPKVVNLLKPVMILTNSMLDEIRSKNPNIKEAHNEILYATNMSSRINSNINSYKVSKFTNNNSMKAKPIHSNNYDMDTVKSLSIGSKVLPFNSYKGPYKEDNYFSAPKTYPVQYKTYTLTNITKQKTQCNQGVIRVNIVNPITMRLRATLARRKNERKYEITVKRSATNSNGSSSPRDNFSQKSNTTQNSTSIGMKLEVSPNQPYGINTITGATMPPNTDADVERTVCCTHEGCKKKFKDKAGMRKHLAVHGPKQHGCVLCGRTFRETSKLQRHQYVHTRERPVRCTQCPKRFAFPYNMKVHMRTHTGDRPYACVICTKRFAQSTNLKAHVRTHNRIKTRRLQNNENVVTKSGKKAKKSVPIVSLAPLVETMEPLPTLHNYEPIFVNTLMNSQVDVAFDNGCLENALYTPGLEATFNSNLDGLFSSGLFDDPHCGNLLNGFDNSLLDVNALNNFTDCNEIMDLPFFE